MLEYVLVRFSKKTGRIDTTFTALGKGMLNMWALQNTTKTKDTIVFERVTGIIDRYYEGTGDFPKVIKDAGNIQDYCEGLLEEINKEENQ